MVCQRHFNMPGADAEPGLRQSEDSDGPVPLGPPRKTCRYMTRAPHEFLRIQIGKGILLRLAA